MAGDTVPVGDASGGGPSDSGRSPPHATSRINAADATMRLERTRAPFERLTVTQRQRSAPASTDARCSIDGLCSIATLVRRGAPRRASSRRVVRRGLRRGEDVHLDPAGRRQGRGAHDRARSRRRRPRLPRARRTAMRTRTGWIATRCSRRPKPRARRSAKAKRGEVVDLRVIVGSGHEPGGARGRGVAGRRQGRRGSARSTTRRVPSARRSRRCRRLRRLAAAAADRDVRRPLGREDRPRIRRGRAGRRQARRREHPDRVPRTGGVRRRRVRRRHPPRAWPSVRGRSAPSRCWTRSRHPPAR